MNSNKSNKEGKVFLSVSIIICIISIYLSLQGFNSNDIKGSQWFILLLTLFTASANLIISRKNKNTYYTLGNVVIIFTIISMLLILVGSK